MQYEAIIKVTQALTIHKISGFEGFNRENVGTQYLTAVLDGWSLSANETLHVAFENVTTRYTVSPILFGYDFKTQRYITEVPTEVMAVEGEWQMQIHKKYNWNSETGKADKTEAGNVDFFWIKYGIRDSADNAVTEYDVANLYNTAVGAVDSAKESLKTLRSTLPYIGKNGNWYIFDAEVDAFVDSGFTAHGKHGMGVLGFEIVNGELIQMSEVESNTAAYGIDPVTGQLKVTINY